jgi:putative hemolysin
MLYVELLIALVLIVVNGLLAMSELAVVSARRGRLKSMADAGSRGADAALRLADDPGRFLSTVQIGITLVGILAGAFSGATLGGRLAAFLVDAGLSTRFAEPLAYGLVVALITYLSLIVGELVPKQLALRNAEAIAAGIAPSMALLARVAAPLVWLLDVSGKAVLGLLGGKRGPESSVTTEEIKVLIAEAESGGALEPRARSMLSGVMRLSERSVRSLMTPRLDVDVVDLGEGAEVALKAVRSSPHALLPALEAADGTVLGVIHAKDLLDAYIRGEPVDPRGHVREAVIIQDTVHALDVLDILKSSPLPMVVVQDEYGHFAGVVTRADILEAIAGAFRSDEPEEPDAVERPDGSWLLSGSMPADELRERLGLVTRRTVEYHTVAGMVLAAMRKLPQTGESVDIGGWRFEVVDVDGRRIDKVLASRLGPGRRVTQPVASS